jgi:PIN domain nuclease of toxin-antitoxin system
LEHIFQIIEKTGFELLPITTNQILVNAGLEYFHSDPFDRIIIAQAMVEDLIIVSKDEQFKKYKASILWKI